MQTETKKCIKRMRSRLERWELTHLRELAANLHAQLEEATERAERAEADAEFWARHASELQSQLFTEQPDAIVGLTMDGALHVQQGGAA